MNAPAGVRYAVHSRVVLGLLLGSLMACSNSTRAPVEDRYARTPGRPPVAVVQSPATYRVQAGDTLYSIAFRYGLDYRKLAAANSIRPPYRIYPGRYMFLREEEIVAVPRVAAQPSAQPATQRRPTPPVATSYPSQPAASVPSPRVKPTPKPATGTPGLRSANVPASKPPASVAFVGAAVKTWRWPTSGRVIRGYSNSVHKGIDISGRRGDAIAAVAAGKVVYAGTGIVGFGELLIVKHNEVYLSAYGHNDRLLVREGETVSAGQKIAEKGSSGTDLVKLHFEIRKEGKPVDPQRVLPRR